MLPTVMPEIFYVTNLPAHLASSGLRSLAGAAWVTGGAALGKSQDGCLNYFLRRKASNGKCNPMLSKCGDVLKEQCYLVSLCFGEI